MQNSQFRQVLFSLLFNKHMDDTIVLSIDFIKKTEPTQPHTKKQLNHRVHRGKEHTEITEKTTNYIYFV